MQILSSPATQMACKMVAFHGRLRLTCYAITTRGSQAPLKVATFSDQTGTNYYFRVDFADLSTCDRLVAKGNGHVCYWLTDELMTRDEAQARCVALGRHLLTVTSESENEAVQSLMEERLQENAAVWLAATETYTTWKWLNGRRIRSRGRCSKS